MHIARFGNHQFLLPGDIPLHLAVDADGPGGDIGIDASGLPHGQFMIVQGDGALHFPLNGFRR